MRKSFFFFTIPLFFFMTAGTALSQEKAKADKQEDRMAAYMALAQPGKAHELLASLAGEWKLDVKIWLQPGAAPLFPKSRDDFRLIS
jgi:hypothetical protein